MEQNVEAIQLKRCSENPDLLELVQKEQGGVFEHMKAHIVGRNAEANPQTGLNNLQLSPKVVDALTEAGYAVSYNGVGVKSEAELRKVQKERPKLDARQQEQSTEAASAALGVLGNQPTETVHGEAMTSAGKKIKGQKGGVALEKGSSIAEALISNAFKNFFRNANATPDREGKPYEGINPKAVQWDELAKWGVSRQDLEKSGDLKELLQGRKSGLVNISFTSEGADGLQVHVQTPARLSLKKNDDGTWGFHYNLKKPKESLNSLDEYCGYKFTEEDRSNLATTGNLGKVIMVDLPALNPKEKTPVLLSLDRLTNELIARNVSDIKQAGKKSKIVKGITVPQSIGGVELTPEQQADLLNGKAVKIVGMLAKDGSVIEADKLPLVQYNAADRKFDYVRNELPNGLKKDLTVDQQVDLFINRKAVRIENVVDRSGKPHTAWVTYNPNKVDKKGQPQSISFWKNEPGAKKNVVAPTLESAVQAQANNDGHKPEALKNVPGAVEQGQGADKTPKQAVRAAEQRKQYTPVRPAAAPAKKSTGLKR